MTDPTPRDIVDFWFPDGDSPSPEEHLRLWTWRMRGGANDEVVARFSDLTERAAAGEFDHWAATPLGRLALLLIFDQFSRSVWAGSPRAYSCDIRARDLCLEGLKNGHFDALENVWQKTAFTIPLVHCECPNHLANADLAVAIAESLVDEAPERLRRAYVLATEPPKSARAVIARFGRHPHRNAVLGRPSTPEEQEYIAKGVFPHESKLELPPEA